MYASTDVLYLYIYILTIYRSLVDDDDDDDYSAFCLTLCCQSETARPWWNWRLFMAKPIATTQMITPSCF